MSIAYRKNAECLGCLEIAPLLMPVRFYPGVPEVHVIDLCLACRVGRTDDKWSVLATTIEHLPPARDGSKEEA